MQKGIVWSRIYVTFNVNSQTFTLTWNFYITFVLCFIGAYMHWDSRHTHYTANNSQSNVVYSKKQQANSHVDANVLYDARGTLHACST